MKAASTNTPKPSQSRFIEPDNWFDVLKWDEWFAIRQSIEVDLGAGDGGFIAARAEANPGINFLAIERLLGRARKIDRKANRLGLSNLRVLRMESLYAIRWLMPAASVQSFTLLFPDPWPKKRHHKNRVIRGEFLGAVERALVPGGSFLAATDHQEYFSEITEAFGQRPGWKSQEARDLEWFSEKTDFERQFLSEGKWIGRLRAVWTGLPSSALLKSADVCR